MSEVLEERPNMIQDDMTAEWCLTQIRNANEEKDRWKEFYKDRTKAVAETCDMTIRDMETRLQSYFDTVPHKVAKTQESYALPSGKLVLKMQETDYERDDEELLKWLHENGGERFIRVKEEVDWMKLKPTLTVMGETVAKDGKVIPCIKAVERPEIFKVELKKT